MTIVNKDSLREMLELLDSSTSEEVEVVPGHAVKVVALTAEGAMEIIGLTDEDKDNAIYVWTSACCLDANMDRVWSVDEVKKLPNKVFAKLSEAVIRMNGLLSSDSVEEAEKNSEKAES